MGKNTDFQKELVSEFRSQKLTTEPTYLETVNATFCRLKRRPPRPPRCELCGARRGRACLAAAAGCVWLAGTHHSAHAVTAHTMLLDVFNHGRQCCVENLKA